MIRVMMIQGDVGGMERFDLCASSEVEREDGVG